jgi:hypothetical protein
VVSVVWLVAAVAATLAAAVFLADRALLWMETRGWIYWRRRKSLSSIGVDLMQDFSPGAQALKRSLEQERVRKNVRPSEEPPFHVDLDSKTVRIRRIAPGSGQEP